MSRDVVRIIAPIPWELTEMMKYVPIAKLIKHTEKLMAVVENDDEKERLRQVVEILKKEQDEITVDQLERALNLIANVQSDNRFSVNSIDKRKETRETVDKLIRELFLEAEARGYEWGNLCDCYPLITDPDLIKKLKEGYYRAK